jgi:FkbM family methyltransferase
MQNKALRQYTKRLSNIRGLRRVPEHFQQKHAADDVEFLIDDFDGDLKFESNLTSHIGSHIFWMGVYARSVLAVLNRIIDRPDRIVFDVGANEGEETLFCAKRLPAGRVYSFEPNGQIRARLERNVALNGFTNVSIEPIGLDREPGALTLYGPSGRHQDGSVNYGQATIYPRPGVDQPIGQITLSSIDHFVAERNISRVDIVKIDVEGAELNVLCGGESMIARDKPQLIVEVWEGTERSRELLNYIVSKGYAIHNIAADGTPSPANDLGRTSRDVLCVAH